MTSSGNLTAVPGTGQWSPGTLGRRAGRGRTSGGTATPREEEGSNAAGTRVGRRPRGCDPPVSHAPRPSLLVLRPPPPGAPPPFGRGSGVSRRASVSHGLLVAAGRGTAPEGPTCRDRAVRPSGGRSSVGQTRDAEPRSQGGRGVLSRRGAEVQRQGTWAGEGHARSRRAGGARRPSAPPPGGRQRPAR